MRSAGTIAALVALALTAGGCKAFDEGLLDAGAPRDGGPGCELRRPPARPAVADAPGDEVFFAIRDMLIDQREDDRWRTAGYDLDGLCSQEPAPAVECYPPAASAPPETDGEGGTDNVLGHQIIPLLLLADIDFQTDARIFQTQGIGTLLVRIRGWSGQPDDPLVDVTLAQSVFGTSRLPDGPVESISFPPGGLQVNGEDWPLPAWEGDDHWWVRSDGFLGDDPERPRVRDDNAYVAGGVLVMRLPDRFPVVFGGDRRAASFTLTDAVFTVQFSEDLSEVDEAILAGRFPYLDILANIEAGGVCRGTSDYMQLQRLLEVAADIRTVPGSGGPSAACDAVSVGLAFESGSRGMLGGIMEGFGIPTPCAMVPDGGAPDAGPGDGGRPDAGPPDAGPADGGAPDAGAGDAGPGDAGPDDAGPGDAGT